jgi:hypothetical protein
MHAAKYRVNILGHSKNKPTALIKSLRKYPLRWKDAYALCQWIQTTSLSAHISAARQILEPLGQTVAHQMRVIDGQQRHFYRIEKL